MFEITDRSSEIACVQERLCRSDGVASTLRHCTTAQKAGTHALPTTARSLMHAAFSHTELAATSATRSSTNAQSPLEHAQPPDTRSAHAPLHGRHAQALYVTRARQMPTETGIVTRHAAYCQKSSAAIVSAGPPESATTVCMLSAVGMQCCKRMQK